MNEESNAQAIIDFARTQLKPELFSHEEGLAFATLPQGQKIESLKPVLDTYLKIPERRKGTASLSDKESFIAHAKRYGYSNCTAIFATPDIQRPRFEVVYDYHDSESGTANWLEHKASYNLKFSDAWNTWFKTNKNSFNQGEFAFFIEGRALDLQAPEELSEGLQNIAAILNATYAKPSLLMELSRGVSINENNKAQSIIDPTSGQKSVQFVSEHADAKGQKFSVPPLFLISIQVFEMGHKYRIPVMLRYRLKDGSISWFYELYRPELVFEQAFKEMKEGIEKELPDFPIFFGSPEK